MASIRVHKYGGSSVATMDKLHKVASRSVELQRQGTQLVLVVSAMGGRTDHLLGLARQVSRDPPRRELDMLLSVGERITTALLAMAIAEQGGSAISLTGSQCGIITDTSHAQARIIEVRPVRVFEGLEAGHIVIVAGFQGVSIDKEVTTLGRGGSDTTAVALAAALGAETCEIYSDVDGVWDADPRLVEDATRIDRLASGEMLAMGLSGAKVLAPEAIDYARRHNIAIHARSAFADGRGTVVVNNEPPGTGTARAVVGDRDILIARARGSSADIDEFSADLLPGPLRCLHAQKNLLNDVADLLLVLSLKDEPDPGGAAERIKLVAGGRVELDFVGNSGMVSVVGTGIYEQAALWRRTLEELASLAVSTSIWWSDPFGLHLVVPQQDLDGSVHILHQRLTTSKQIA